jgi:hypothetical protein
MVHTQTARPYATYEYGTAPLNESLTHRKADWRASVLSHGEAGAQ